MKKLNIIILIVVLMSICKYGECAKESVRHVDENVVFNETLNSIYDLSEGNNAVVLGVALDGGVGTFNGADYLQYNQRPDIVPDYTSLLTMICRVRFDNFDAQQNLMYEGTSNGDTFTKIQWFVNTSGIMDGGHRETPAGTFRDWDPSTTTLETNRWYELAVCLDTANNTVNYYVDGALTNSASSNGTGQPITESAVNIRKLVGAGNAAGVPANFLNGRMDFLQIYNVCLTSKDIELFFEKSLYIDSTNDGMLGRWPVSRVESANDISGNNQDGVWSGGADYTFDQYGRAGNAFLGNGIRYILLPSSLVVGADDFSVTYWVKVADGYASEGHIFGRGGGGIVGSFVSRFASGSINVGLSNETQINLPGFNDGNWHQIVITCDRDGNMVVFVDSVSQATQDISGSSGVPINNNTFAIGTENDSTPSNTITGSISDVRLYSRILSKTEIDKIYRQGSRRIIND